GIYLFHRIQYTEDSSKLSSPLFQVTLMITLSVLLLLVPIDYRGYSFSLFFVPMLLIQSKVYIKISGMVIVGCAHYFLTGHNLVEIAIFAALYLIVIFSMPFFKSMNTNIITW